MKQLNGKSLKGLFALSPIFVFLAVYLVTSIVVSDFYKVPVSSAFLIASCYAMLITKGLTVSERVDVFSSGAAHKNVLLMVWIFLLSGVFAKTATQIGAVDATVSIALALVPGKMLFVGFFLIACFISFSIGTSVGTIVALVPVVAGISQETGVDLARMTAIVVGGAFFGDNLSFISDTTIAATKATGCEMRDKFKANFRIVLPAVLIVSLIYIIQGGTVDLPAQEISGRWYMILPYLTIITLALCGMNVILVLLIGIVLNALLGVVTGTMGWVSFLSSMGAGVASMGDLVIVTMLAGGMLALIRQGGGLDFIIDSMTRRVRGRRGAELCIAALVSIANFCTANNTIAIITTGEIASGIASKFGVEPRRAASLLDTFSCMIQGILPYGAQLLMASALSEVPVLSIIPKLYYPAVLGLCAIAAILLSSRRQARA